MESRETMHRLTLLLYSIDCLQGTCSYFTGSISSKGREDALTLCVLIWCLTALSVNDGRTLIKTNLVRRLINSSNIAQAIKACFIH
jgi:hypothetical protein